MLHRRSQESVAFLWVSPLPISEVKHPSGNYTMLLVWLKKKKIVCCFNGRRACWKFYTGPQIKSSHCAIAWLACLQDKGEGCGCQPGSSNTSTINHRASLIRTTFTQRQKKKKINLFVVFSINTVLYQEVCCSSQNHWKYSSTQQWKPRALNERNTVILCCCCCWWR